jgi:hypothetical protein
MDMVDVSDRLNVLVDVSDQLVVSDTVVALVELDKLKVEKVWLEVVTLDDDESLPVVDVAVIDDVDTEVVVVRLEAVVIVKVFVVAVAVQLAVDVVLVAVLPVPPLHVQQTS